jgi:hypothetical protein
MGPAIPAPIIATRKAITDHFARRTSRSFLGEVGSSRQRRKRQVGAPLMESLIGTRRRRSAVKTIMLATTANMPMSRLTRRPASRVLRSDIRESYCGSERRATVIDPLETFARGSFVAAILCGPCALEEASVPSRTAPVGSLSNRVANYVRLLGFTPTLRC